MRRLRRERKISFDALVGVSGATGDAATRGAIHPEATGTAIAAAMQTTPPIVSASTLYALAVQ